MSSLPQAGLSGHTDPIATSLAVVPVLSFRTPSAVSRTAEVLADGPSAEELAEDRLAEIVELLASAVELGVAGTLELGAVPQVGFESIVCALDSQDVTQAGDTFTVATITPQGRLAVTVQVDADGQVAA
ncbi:hypothetical protein [Kitasatospora griseola]|uniref:hypothetical protein n=1 Tax=Kitasatospora griseola TaxID=2064 RepID=UPI00343A3AA4